MVVLLFVTNHAHENQRRVGSSTRNKQSLIAILGRFGGDESRQVNNMRHPSLRIFEMVFEAVASKWRLSLVDSYLETYMPTAIRA